MDGLYKQERFETFTAEGWYPTGDRGWFDEEGFLHFTGRGNAMIKTAGSNVSPEEVEAAIREVPGVTDVFVLGLPHPVRGEEVAAAIAVKPGSTLAEGDVISHARGELASYKVPRHVCLIIESQVPLLPTGKVDRTSLVQLFDDRTR
jgi:acyl-CoA synthetase (AMP-forming)/AMP-acid ligase II